MFWLYVCGFIGLALDAVGGRCVRESPFAFGLPGWLFYFLQPISISIKEQWGCVKRIFICWCVYHTLIRISTPVPSFYIHLSLFGWQWGGSGGCICICSFICLMLCANIAYVKAPTQSDFPVRSDNWRCDGEAERPRLFSTQTHVGCTAHNCS